MDKSLGNLSIRVRLPEEVDYKVKEEVVILWERIFWVGLLALILLASLVGGYIGLVKQEPAPESAPAPSILESPVEEVNRSTAHFSKGEAVEVTSLPNEIMAASDPLIDLNPAQLALPSPSLEPQNELVTTDLSENKIAQVAHGSGLVDLANSETIELAAVEESTQGNSAAQSVGDEIDPSNPKIAPVTMSSDNLLRAVLTTGIKNREPLNNAPYIMSVADGELLKVFFFTELKGLRKQPVFFEWFLNDKRVARVEVRPRLATSSNYSSKFIDQHMRGKWRVVTLKQDGELLATATFEVH
jgi:hypothetical protein